ncbi:unnamed protein product, partial [Darwinula stevensoni]
RWKGKVALVTGASSGIGAATAFKLAKAGMKVAACARRADRIQQMVEELGDDGSMMAIKCDLTNDEDVDAMFSQIMETWGGIDVCINNAALCGPVKITDGDRKEWRKLFDLNVIAYCYCSKKTVESLKVRDCDEGHIINICSIGGHRVFEPIPKHYNVTKFAVTAITESLRLELKETKRNIRASDHGAVEGPSSTCDGCECRDWCCYCYEVGYDRHEGRCMCQKGRFYPELGDKGKMMAIKCDLTNDEEQVSPGVVRTEMLDHVPEDLLTLVMSDMDPLLAEDIANAVEFIISAPPHFEARMERWKGKVALVTGASSGIGAAIAMKLAKAGMKVAACARRVDRIQQMMVKLGDKGTMLPIKCDLTNDEEVDAMFSQIMGTWGGIDVVISLNSDGDRKDWRYLLNLNVIALCYCSKRTVESLKERDCDEGHIINICSIAGHWVYNVDPNLYNISKFAVTAVTESLRLELKETKKNIRASHLTFRIKDIASCVFSRKQISPGLVWTEMVENHLPKDRQAELKSKMDPLQAEDIANAVEFMLSAPPHVEVNDMIIWPTRQKMQEFSNHIDFAPAVRI